MSQASPMKLGTAILIVISLFAPEVNAYELPDTGITRCYGYLILDQCPLPGEPFYGQDAQYASCEPGCTYNGNGTVTLNCTGQMWQNDLSSAGGNKTWQEANTYCEDLLLAGYDDWRLPDAHELESIINYASAPDTGEPAVDTSCFPEIIGYDYWSSTSYVGDASKAFGVVFTIGRVYLETKGSPNRVICVRGTSMPTPSFSDNGDGTITDNVTKLMWQKQPYEDSMLWEGALAYCESLELAGRTDWRLPSVMELTSIVNYSVYLPATYASYFPLTESGPYASSSPDRDHLFQVFHYWVVDFAAGESALKYSYDESYVRCLRGACTPEPEVCNDGVDNDCDGLTDCIGAGDPDCDCGGVYGAAANAQASTYGGNSLMASGSFNALGLLVVPVGAVVALRILRRKR